MGTNISNYDKNSQVEILGLTIRKPNMPVNQATDISSVMDQVIIYEDLLQSSITAKLIFRDQMNLVGTYPIVGGEVINFKYKTPIYDDIINLDFVVYQVGERGIDNSNENIQINSLMLCTPEIWWAANNDVSGAYKGTYTDIISKLLTEVGTKKTFDKEDTVGIVSYVGVSWDHFKTIDFCATRANSKSLSPVFFWETKEGYHLKSLKEIYRANYEKQIYIEDRSVAGADTDANKVFNTAYSFEYLSSNNRLKQYGANAFGSDIYMVDPTNARVLKVTPSYDYMFNKDDIKLNKYPLNDDAKSIRNVSEYMPYRSDMSHLTGYNKKATRVFMDNLRVLVNIPGDSKLKAGDVVGMDIPVKTGLTIGPEPVSSGKWLVRSSKHLINKNTYSMICELVKDSFDMNVTKNN